MRRTIKISPKKTAIKGSLKADYVLFNERVGAPIFVPPANNNGGIFAINQYTHLDTDNISYKPVLIVENTVEILHKTRFIISVQVINPEDQIDPYDVQTIKYRWYKNGSYLYEVNNLNDFKGGTAIQFTEDQCTPAISGIYTVEATNDSGTTVSSELTLRVHDPLNTLELYGNLIYNSSGEADLDGWIASPGISIQQFSNDSHRHYYGENASIARRERLKTVIEDDVNKLAPKQFLGTFSFERTTPYSFKPYYNKLQSYLASNGGLANYDPEAFARTFSEHDKWRYTHKLPNLVQNENGDGWPGSPPDWFGSFYPSKDYLDEYNNNVKSSITAEGSLPGWYNHISTYFARDPIKFNEDSTLTMTQQIDVSNINGFIDGNVCGVDKVVGNLFAYVGTGIDSYNYRVVFEDIHKSVPTNEQLFREVISNINTWDADLRYSVEGFATPWDVRGPRNPIPNIYRAPTLVQRSAYMDQIYPTIFDSISGRLFTYDSNLQNDIRLNYRSGSLIITDLPEYNNVEQPTATRQLFPDEECFNFPQFRSRTYYTASTNVLTTQLPTFGARFNYTSTENVSGFSRSTKHLYQDFGYIDDDWAYTSAPYTHQRDFTSSLGLLQGNISAGIPANYQGPWNWFGRPAITAGTVSTSGSYVDGTSWTSAIPSSSINSDTRFVHLASSYAITARYLNSLSILAGGRTIYELGGDDTQQVSSIPSSSVLNFTNLRYKANEPIEYTAASPLSIANYGTLHTSPLTKTSYWRDFNPPTHTISSYIEENKGIYSSTHKPDPEHPEGFQTEQVLLDFLKDRTPITLGFNCDYFAKAAALVPGSRIQSSNTETYFDIANKSTWVENGYYVEKTIGEFEYEPPQWKYPLLKRLYETSIGGGYEYSSYLSDFAVIFNRLLMIQNINQAHPDYDIENNPHPIKGPILNDLYLDSISRTIDTAKPFVGSNPSLLKAIFNNQYKNLPDNLKLASPSLYYQDKYVSYIHKNAGLPGGRNTCYAPHTSGSPLPTSYNLYEISSREAITQGNPDLLPDISPLPTDGEELQQYIDKIVDGLNTRFEDAEDFIMNMIIRPFNEDLFRIPNIENLTEEQIDSAGADPAIQVLISAIHLISTNRTFLAGGLLEPTPGSPDIIRIRQGFGPGDNNIDTSNSLRWYHKQFGSPTYGAVDALFAKPVTETVISNSKLFSNPGAGPLLGFYDNQVATNSSTEEIQSTIDSVDASTFNEKTGQRRPESEISYQYQTPAVLPSNTTGSMRMVSDLLTYPIGSLSVASNSLPRRFLGVITPTDAFGSPGFNRSPSSGSTEANKKATVFPLFPSFDAKSSLGTYYPNPIGFTVLRAPLAQYWTYVPSAEIKSSLFKEFSMAHAPGGGVWWEDGPEQQWHEYIRKALVYWVYVYRGGRFAEETGDTLLLPAAPDIELNTTMMTGEQLMRLHDIEDYPLIEYRHILSGVHDNVSYQGARIEMTPKADNQVKFRVRYINENQEIIGEDVLNGPTVDDIFAVKEKIFLPTLIGSLIQKTCILPLTRTVPVLYDNKRLFSVTNNEIISSTSEFIELFGMPGSLEAHGVSSGVVVGEVIGASPEDRDSDEWRSSYEIVGKLSIDRGAAAFFAVQKKLFLPKGTLSLEVEVSFENNSISRNTSPIKQGPLKYEADTIPAMHTTYPYALYEYGYPRTGVCLIKLCLYDNEFKRTTKYPQYYIPATHVWSVMKQTMQTYGPLAYLEGYSLLGRYGQAPTLFNAINYRTPDRSELQTLQQNLRTIRNFVFTEEMRELFHNNGYIANGEPPSTITKLNNPSETYDLTTVSGIQNVQAIFVVLKSQQLESGLLTNNVQGNIPASSEGLMPNNQNASQPNSPNYTSTP
jgi:hypothetical protein